MQLVLSFCFRWLVPLISLSFLWFEVDGCWWIPAYAILFLSQPRRENSLLNEFLKTTWQNGLDSGLHQSNRYPNLIDTFMYSSVFPIYPFISFALVMLDHFSFIRDVITGLWAFISFGSTFYRIGPDPFILRRLHVPKHYLIRPPLRLHQCRTVRYHRHYHHRLQFLHRRRPHPPKLPQPLGPVFRLFASVRHYIIHPCHSSLSFIASAFTSGLQSLHLYLFPPIPPPSTDSGIYSIPILDSAQFAGHKQSKKHVSSTCPWELSLSLLVGSELFVETFNPADPEHWIGLSGFASYTPRSFSDIPDETLNPFCRRLDPVKFHHTNTLFDSSLTSNLHHLPNVPKALYSAITTSSPSYLLAKGPDDMPIVIDTGASTSLTPVRSDFITFQPVSSSVEGIGASIAVRGRGLVRWKITDQYGVEGTIITMAIYAPDAPIRLYSPQFHFRKKMGGEMRVTHTDVILRIPTSDAGDLSLQDLSFPYHPQSILPLMLKSDHSAFLKSLFATHPCRSVHAFTSLDSLRRVPLYEDIDTLLSLDTLSSYLADSSNPNLSSAQKELLVWHWRLGHVDMARIQRLMRPSSIELEPSPSPQHLVHPVVIPTRQRTTHRCSVPLCQACIYGKQTKRPSESTSTRRTPQSQDALSRGQLTPGQKISMDQYIVADKGRLFHTAGKEAQNQRFSGGTIFRDHASGFIFLHHQVSLRAGETLVGKRLFEQVASWSGIRISHYHGDNGVFTSKEFCDHCSLHSQRLTFSGVGSQHQNGVAERSIRTVFSLARSMMIHSAILWPDSHDKSLWPMAVDYAVWVLNHLPSDSDGISPIEKFTGQKFENYHHLRRARVWGCPCYVLDPVLQNGKKVPKFKPRSRQGKFLGFSPDHSSNVGVILNRQTGRLSPQFHVVYDDYYQTVCGVADLEDVDLDSIDWDRFITPANTEIYFDPDDTDHPPPPVHSDWRPHLERGAPRVRFGPGPSAPPSTVPFPSSSSPGGAPGPSCLRPSRFSEGAPLPSEGASSSLSEGATASVAEGAPTPSASSPIISIDLEEECPEGVVSGSEELVSVDDARDAAVAGLRRSSCSRAPNPRIFNDDFITSSFYTPVEAASRSSRKFTRAELDAFELQNLDWKSSLSLLAGSDDLINGDSQRFFAAMEHLEDPRTGDLESYPTLALLNRANAADNPRYHEAMSGPNREGFLNASILEICTLQNMKAWTQVKREPDMNVVPSTWAFKIKRFPDGLVRKLKARFCVRGDKQIEGVDFFDTFAPVVQWSTVRLLLILSLSLGLATTQVDYIAAFCQAPIDEDVFINLPLGWRRLNGLGIPEKFKDGHVLKLNRSVYGLRQSPKNFFEHLKGNLFKCGFHQSNLDPCLFYHEKVICVTYVDDCLFFARDKDDITEAIANIKATGMDLQVEDDVAGFLGVHIDRQLVKNDEDEEVERITLLQTGLIDQIILALGIDSKSNGTLTPAPLTPLTKDLDGTPFDHSFNYASVIGMLLYLCNNSRPDITFAVSQCSRFTHNPTMHHADYLRRIGRYLLRTRTKGLTLTRSSSLDIDCYVDADFCGLYNHEEVQDPSSVKSRTGFVIRVGGCPVIWSSKLQSEITLSTMEAEYVACSTACRELVPIHSLVNEIASELHLSSDSDPIIHTTIWEDNNGALALANLELPRLTPRSCHISVKYHWFRSLVSTSDDRAIRVRKISTLDQIGDLFTKGLGPSLFVPLRHRLMGW